MANGKPKPIFYAAVFLVVAGLIGVAIWRYGAAIPGGGGGQFSSDELKQLAGGAEKPERSGSFTENLRKSSG